MLVRDECFDELGRRPVLQLAQGPGLHEPAGCVEIHHRPPGEDGPGPHRGPGAEPEERARADAQLSTSGQANRRRLPEYQRRSSSMAVAKGYRGLQPSCARIFSIDMRLRGVTIPMAV